MRSTSARWWALIAFALSMLVVGLDATVLSVAGPTLARELNASQADLEWFSTAFMLTMAAGMLPAGAIADRCGRKKTLVAALVLFAACSSWCAYATSPTSLIAARTLMGLGAACIAVLTLGMVPVLFASHERTRAIGIMMAANFIGMPAGPILGGWILTHHWWGWVFLMNVPVAVVAILLVAVLVPESRPATVAPLDAGGLLGSAAGIAALCYGFVEAGQNGWGHAATLTWLALSVVVLATTVAWELRLARSGKQPALPPALFRLPGFTVGTIVPWIAQLAQVGLLFVIPLFTQGIQGHDAMGSGLRLLPLVGGVMVAALSADFLGKHVGPKLTAGGGFALMAVAALLGTRMGAASPDSYLISWLFLAGLGMGLGMVTSSSVALAHVPPDEANSASAVMQAIQRTSAPLGTALLGSTVSSVYQSHLSLPASLPAAAVDVVKQGLFQGLAVAHQVPGIEATVRDAFVSGMHASFWVAVALGAVAAVVALAALPMHAPRADASSAPAVDEKAGM